MNTNKFFSPARFFRLLRNDWLINQKLYLFTLLGFSIVLYAFTYFTMSASSQYYNDDYFALFIVFLLGSGVVVGTAFPALKDQIKTSSYLLTPGSTIEKFLVQFTIRILVFIPIALSIFWLCTHLAKASIILYHQAGVGSVVDVKDFHYRDLISEFDYGFRISASLIFSGICILFAGSVFFKRFALVKTLIISAIILGIVFLTFVLFSHLFFSDITYGFNNILEEQVFKWRFGRYNIFRIENRFGMKMFWSGFGYLTWLFFLALAYFKLKEKEV